MSATISLPGFADPVEEAQATFRAVLDAMARPGTLHRAGERLAPPVPLDQAAAAVLLTLVDNETPLWLDAARGGGARLAGLPLRCHDRSTTPLDAAFAAALSLPDLSTLPAGSHEVPEASATLILQVAALGSGTRYRLSGPGLREPSVFAASGLPAGFAAVWQRNHALYPRGMDIILCAGATIAALPRSVSHRGGLNGLRRRQGRRARDRQRACLAGRGAARRPAVRRSWRWHRSSGSSAAPSIA